MEESPVEHLDFVDFKNLNDRLKANSVQEKLANLWLGRVFGKEEYKAMQKGG